MTGLNKTILIGRLTKKPEIKKTQSNLSVTQYTVAVERFRTSNNGPTADFISCVTWRQSADYLSKYGQKGTLVAIEGSIQTRNYVAKDGNKRYVTEVLTDQVQILNQPKTQQAPVNNQYQPTNENDTQNDYYDYTSNDQLPF